MDRVKKIALVTCVSNYERYNAFVRTVHEELKARGNYVLYVITNYSVFLDGMQFLQGGDSSIYRLLDMLDLDGCIFDSNLASNELTELLATPLRKRGIPTLSINLKAEGTPYLQLDTRPAARELIEHLIDRHGCTRINLVLSIGNSVVSQDLRDVYEQILEEKGIAADERRILTTIVSEHIGKEIYEHFDERGVMQDAQAILCVHDVNAISLCLEFQRRGIRIPEDIRICSANFSGNSAAFRPRITGIDLMDRKAAREACSLMDRMIRGEAVPERNTYGGVVRYGSSCGCGDAPETEEADSIFQRIVMNKIQAGRQISQMMRFNELLEEVVSLDQLSENIHEMMTGVGCNAYFCCLNESDLAYIENTGGEEADRDVTAFDDYMVALAGNSERTGKVSRKRFPLRELAPVPTLPGDMLMVMPITHRMRVFGYMVLINEDLPLEVFNYRICQENIGSSIENLHRQMILRSSIAELDRLHIQDHLTGLYNRFALDRFAGSFTSLEFYTVVMLDLDDLKGVNDHYGHLAGNHMISMAAQVLRENMGKDDVIIRYGGDEFLVLSACTDETVWEERRQRINLELEEISRRQSLPYHPGLSLGYAVSRGDSVPISEAINRADNSMYRNKESRKAMRPSQTEAP